MSGRPRRDRYRFPESRDSRIAMVATLLIFLAVVLVFIVIIFRQGTIIIPTPTPEASGIHRPASVVALSGFPSTRHRESTTIENVPGRLPIATVLK